MKEELFISNVTLTEDRICSILKQQLYKMADDNSIDDYEPLNLKWTIPIDGTQGMISVLKNAAFVLSYVQNYKCNTEYIDRIIENDFRPMVCDLKNEYDFVLAGVIFVVCSTIEDYSDETIVMKFETDVLGKFVSALEIVDKEINSKNDSMQTKPVTEQEVDTFNLEIGMVVSKGYKELCILLNEKPLKSGSNSYKAQLKRWARYFKMEKGRGRSLVILDVYDEPLPVEDGRKNGNRNIYLKYIETILLKYIYYKKGKTCYATRNQLWLILGMINNNYRKIPAKILRTEIDYIDVTDWELNKFYMRCNTKLNSILFSALNNLSNRSLIAYEIQTMIVVPDKGASKHHVADDNEIRKILAVERNILNKMGFESKNHAACCMKMVEFYDAVNTKLFELYGWERKYERLKIIFNERDIKDAMAKNEYELQMMYLNELVIEAIDKNAQTVVDNRMKKALAEYDDYLTEWKCNNWGKAPKLEEVEDIFTYPKYFVDIQRKLSQKFLSIKPKKDYKEKNGFYDDELAELEELFANLGQE